MKKYEKYLKTDQMHEYFSGFGMRSTSLVNPPADTAVRSALSSAGDDDDASRKADKIRDMVKSGDAEAAAKLAAKYSMRYGDSFGDIGDATFKSLYAKAKEALKSGEKDKPKAPPKKKEEEI